MPRYKDKSMEAHYRALLSDPSLTRNADGSRRSGAGHREAFWRGYDNARLSGNRVPYLRTSLAFAAYMAGREVAKARNS